MMILCIEIYIRKKIIKLGHMIEMNVDFFKKCNDAFILKEKKRNHRDKLGITCSTSLKRCQ